MIPADVIWYNTVWFLLIFYVVFIYGIIWEFSKVTAIAIGITFLLFVLAILLFTIIHFDEVVSSAKDWYYYIGPFFGGFIYKIPFNAGRRFIEKLFEFEGE